MYALELTKPDGRALRLYGRQPVTAAGPAPAPAGGTSGSAHFRWHALRGEWVVYAPHRQTRTFLPPPEYNPLRPAPEGATVPTELPEGDYDVAVFDNLFPSMTPSAGGAPELIVPTRPGKGRCEVVVFTQDPEGALGRLPLDHVGLLIEVWGRRTLELGEQRGIRYVLPFENRGVEVGVTLHHPHGQIYAYPFVPPLPARMQAEERRHWRRHGRTLLEVMLEREREAGTRILYDGEFAVAWVPVCARYPYEVWIAPRRPLAWLHELEPDERLDLARALKTVLLKYDGLWDRPFPYVMAWFQAPTDGRPHPEAHLHAEFYPPFRGRDRLKYLAGTELAAGLFVCDRLPEETVRELQAVSVTVAEPVSVAAAATATAGRGT